MGSGWARRKATYNFGKTKGATGGANHKSNRVNEDYLWGDGVLSHFTERATVYDWQGPVEFDSPVEFFNSPWYRYIGHSEMNGVITHDFMLIPEDSAEAEDLYRFLHFGNMEPPKE